MSSLRRIAPRPARRLDGEYQLRFEAAEPPSGYAAFASSSIDSSSSSSSYTPLAPARSCPALAHAEYDSSLGLRPFGAAAPVSR
ncbi:hypothetical protein NESM_000920800 [Novymonas esmeraldas]|uniref:Uncharacterized protein n=1 Tax=Novymonas esmeraldas TaxID=1808958 RepID=A0AAW0F2M3_9TRYP